MSCHTRSTAAGVLGLDQLIAEDPADVFQVVGLIRRRQLLELREYPLPIPGLSVSITASNRARRAARQTQSSRGQMQPGASTV